MYMCLEREMLKHEFVHSNGHVHIFNVLKHFYIISYLR